MQDSHGNRFTTTPEKRQHLEEHWQQVFAAKEYQKDAGKQWFRKAFPDGQGLENFPARDAENRRIHRSDVRKAIDLSNKSAPGPDGIPYRIWRQLGGTAVEYIWQASQDLQSDQATDLLEELGVAGK